VFFHAKARRLESANFDEAVASQSAYETKLGSDLGRTRSALEEPP